MTDQLSENFAEPDAFEAALAANVEETAPVAPVATEVVDSELALSQDEAGDVVEDENALADRLGTLCDRSGPRRLPRRDFGGRWTGTSGLARSEEPLPERSASAVHDPRFGAGLERLSL